MTTIISILILIIILSILFTIIADTTILYFTTKIFRIKKSTWKKNLKVIILRYILIIPLSIPVIIFFKSSILTNIIVAILGITIIALLLKRTYKLEKIFKIFVTSLIFSIIIFIVNFILNLGIAYLKINVFENLQVAGGAMCPTLNQINKECRTGFGEFILNYKATKNFKRGDIIAININKDILVKRIIGLPNEKIEFKNGKLYINNKELSEPYLSEKDKGVMFSKVKKFNVPENRYFLLGDNRSNSLDSRVCYSNTGCSELNMKDAYIKPSQITGKITHKIWPNFEKLENPFSE